MQELEIVREKIQNKYRVVKTDEDLEWNRAIDLCTNIINAHMKHINDDWIPVKERLPEEEYYPALCVTNENYYCVAVYNKTHGFRTGDICTVGEIVAWRPLPKLYKPKRSDNA